MMLIRICLVLLVALVTLGAAYLPCEPPALPDPEATPTPVGTLPPPTATPCPTDTPFPTATATATAVYAGSLSIPDGLTWVAVSSEVVAWYESDFFIGFMVAILALAVAGTLARVVRGVMR